MPEAYKHPQAKLYPFEVATLALLFGLKGVSNRAFYRWLTCDYRSPFPDLPAHTRLLRLSNALLAQQLYDCTIPDWVDRQLRLIHLHREGQL